MYLPCHIHTRYYTSVAANCASTIDDLCLINIKHVMAALRGQFLGLANDRNLRRFVVQARPTGRQLGTGSYGTVEEVIDLVK